MSPANAMPRRVLVAYATARGSTREVGEHIAANLRATGLDAVAAPADTVDSVDQFGAVVIGSAIQNGRWLPAAVTFVGKHRTELRKRPTWLFSVATIGASSSALPGIPSTLARRLGPVPKNLPGLRAELRPVDHRVFAGVISRGDWGRGGDLFLRMMGGRYGDHRDWRDIDAWASTIVAGLSR